MRLTPRAFAAKASAAEDEFFQAWANLSIRWAKGCEPRNRERAQPPLPALIVSMSRRPGIPWRVARRQSPPPLPRLLPGLATRWRRRKPPPQPGWGFFNRRSREFSSGRDIPSRFSVQRAAAFTARTRMSAYTQRSRKFMIPRKRLSVSRNALAAQRAIIAPYRRRRIFSALLRAPDRGLSIAIFKTPSERPGTSSKRYPADSD